MKRIVVLGAGIAGISAAYHAKEMGHENIVVFEKTNNIGGLVDNFQVDNFRYDNAVHLSFTKNPYVKKLFDAVPHYNHQPISYNYESGLWLKHPVQNNLYPLSTDDKVKAIKSFVDRPTLHSNDYQSWLISQYGEYIAERYPLRYTKKYWTLSPDRLSLDWVGNRMSQLNLEEILKGAFECETPNYFYANEMRYPKYGGYKSFIQPMIDRVRENIQLNKEFVLVNEREKWIEFSDGKKEHYDVLVSSIPLPELTKRTVHGTSELSSLANTLCATSIALISIGFNRPDIPKYLWFYMYDENILPARAYSPSLKSKFNVPEGCSSLQFEIYFSKYRPLKMEQSLVVEHVIKKIEQMGIATRNDIIVTDYREIKYGNVIFDHEMIKRRNIIKDYMKENDIHLIGRFGEWDYLWSDQSLLSGKETIEKIIKGDT